MEAITKENLDYIIKKTEKGKGLFAANDIKAGTILFAISGKLINFDQSNKLEEDSYSLQIDINTYIVPHHPFFLLNHSCEPDCGINNRLEMVAIKDIKKDKELQWDYSTSMLERNWTMPCDCRTVNCRKTIGDFDLLP
ncbi:MAG: SET domain-containing protein [Chitinophagaceae bacterium]|nr:SET domain-containing protein [Chitinophagaceae bacterium]